jgi:uncharacterized membrane protein YfcA
MIELLLLGAGLAAGALNTLAGGGSFVLFPALLATGIPPVIANATNTFASMPGYISGAAGFRKELLAHRRRLLPYSVIALGFGYLGAELLLRVSNEAFGLAVPWLMLFAVLLFAFGARINALVQRLGHGEGRWFAGLLWVLLAAIALYGGFFNAGLGVLLLAFLALAGMTDIHAMNGLKLWVSSLVSVVGVARFALSGAVDWYFGAFALVGVVSGAYLAARLAHLVPTRVLRTGVLVYSIGLTLWFFRAAYAG